MVVIETKGLYQSKITGIGAGVLIPVDVKLGFSESTKRVFTALNTGTFAGRKINSS